MYAHKVELLVLDADNLGADEVQSVIENTNYPNRCISVSALKMHSIKVYDWSDEHPLNNRNSQHEAVKIMFGD